MKASDPYRTSQSSAPTASPSIAIGQSWRVAGKSRVETVLVTASAICVAHFKKEADDTYDGAIQISTVFESMIHVCDSGSNDYSAQSPHNHVRLHYPSGVLVIFLKALHREKINAFSLTNLDHFKKAVELTTIFDCKDLGPKLIRQAEPRDPEEAYHLVVLASKVDDGETAAEIMRKIGQMDLADYDEDRGFWSTLYWTWMIMEPLPRKWVWAYITAHAEAHDTNAPKYDTGEYWEEVAQLFSVRLREIATE
ncbi:hypothetical protein IAU59_001752 [Kwoniella sp. CBS 9459]